MSLKSALLVETVAPVTVIVAAVPSVLVLTKRRLVGEFPLRLRAPVTVKLEFPLLKTSVLVAVPVLVRVLKVPLQNMDAVPPPLKTTL